MKKQTKLPKPLAVRSLYRETEERLFGLTDREAAAREVVPCRVLFSMLGEYFRQTVDASFCMPTAPDLLLAVCERGLSAAFLAIVSECAAVLSPLQVSFDRNETHVYFSMAGALPPDCEQVPQVASETAALLGMDAALFAYMEQVADKNGFRIFSKQKDAQVFFTFEIPVYRESDFAVRTTRKIRQSIVYSWHFTGCILMNRHLSPAEQDRCFLCAKKEIEKSVERL